MVKSAVRVAAVPVAVYCAGVEQYTGIDRCLVEFAVRFMKRPAEERRGFRAPAAEYAGTFPDEVKDVAVEFIRDLCEEADKREYEGGIVSAVHMSHL